MKGPAADRRPIAARRLAPFLWLADRLVRFEASPDAISLAGMACGLLAGLCLAFAPVERPLWLAGAALVQLRLLANMMDGMVALGRGVASPLGELFNEVPDRVSDTAVLLGLGVAAGSLALGLGAALAAMSTAYVRAAGRTCGAESDFSGPMAKQQRMAVVTVAAVWCGSAPSALGRRPAVLDAGGDHPAVAGHRAPSSAADRPRAARGGRRMMLRVAAADEMFESPVTVVLVSGVLAALTCALVVVGAVTLTGRASPALRRELWLRLGSWVLILPAMILPVLAGKPWLIAAATVLGLLCLREFSRATGLFRETAVLCVASVGVLAVNFAALDHWYGFFVALSPLTVSAIAVASLPLDHPDGYIQRTGLGVFGFMLFGAGLAHLGYMANDPGYRPFVLLLLLSVALSDVLAFTFGKLIGGPKLLRATSPGKTVSGALGACCVTTGLVALGTHAIFLGAAVDQPLRLVTLGMLVGVAAQAGDLMLSSIKRDVGVKDMGTALPGHGGVLDRFNSLLLVAPVAFHFVGFGMDAPTRVITGG